MNLNSIFKPVYSEQSRDFLEMSFLSPIGVRIDFPNGAKYVELLHRFCCSFAIINCSDISESISELKKVSRTTNIIAHLDKSTDYYYNGGKKSMLSSYALLYDFVDAFVISGFDELSDDIDQLINLRMYNDEYRPILMEVPDDLLLDELDEIISYARLSNIDGLLISNKRLLRHAVEKCAGALTLIYECKGEDNDAAYITGSQADLLCISAGRRTLMSIFKGRRLIKLLHKSFALQPQRQQ